MATYAEQILICTGRADWKSRIEDEDEAVLARQLKKFLTRGGKYVDVRWQLRGHLIETDDSSIAVPQRLDYKFLIFSYTLNHQARERS